MHSRHVIPLSIGVCLTIAVVVLLTRPDRTADNNPGVESEAKNENGAEKKQESTEAAQKTPEPDFKSKPLPQWLDQLQKGNEEERIAAAKALATGLELKDKTAIPVLIEALKDKKSGVRSKAAEALGRFGPLAKEAVPALIEAGRDKDWVREPARNTLKRIGTPAILPLIEALRHENTHVRMDAATALGAIGPPAKQALPALVEALQNDKEEWVRAYAADALGRIGPSAEHVPALLKALREDKESTVRFNAVHALGSIGPAAKDAVPDMIKALDDKEIRYPAAGALARIGPTKEAIPALTRTLKDRDKSLFPSLARRDAANALGKVGPEAKSAVPELIDILQDQKEEGPGMWSSNTRGAAARALGKIGAADKRVLPALIEVLKGIDDPKSQLGSLLQDIGSALGDMGPAAADAVPALVQRYNDGANVYGASGIITALQGIGEPAVPHLAEIYARAGDNDMGGSDAEAALTKLGPKAHAAVPALIEKMKTKPTGKNKPEMHSYWRQSAAGILAKIGPKAKDAVPVLLDAAKDTDVATRDAAAYALYQIDPPAARRAGIAEPPMHTKVFLNSDRSHFVQDYLGIGSGDPIGGKVILWVNGDPVGFFEGGGQMFDLDSWLRRGKNEVALSGKHDNAVYVLLANNFGMRHFQGVAGKKEFAGPGSDELAQPLVWTADQVPDLPQREELSSRPEDRQRHETEIRALLAQIKDSLKAHDGDKAARQLWRGLGLWSKSYGSSKNVEEDIESLAKLLADPKISVLDEDPPMRLIFGKRLVLAYVERPEDAKNGPHLVTVERNGERSGIDQLQFARVNGEWIIWDAPHGLHISLSVKVE